MILTPIGFKTVLIVGLVGALGTLGAGIGGYFKGHKAGEEAKLNELSAAWEKQQHIQAMDFAAQIKASRDDLERTRAEDRAKDVKHEQAILDSERRAAALAASLRNRPERPAAGASVPASGQAASAPACSTGAGLCRPDAEFLVGLAARANQLRADLERCQGPEPVTDGGRLDR